jgi:hypothetical protein
MPTSPDRFRLELCPLVYAICQLGPDDAVPAFAAGPGFLSITRTKTELSIVCDEARVPPGVRHVGGRRAFGLAGVVDFATIGVLAGLLKPQADAGVSVFVVSTYDTDYILVEERNAETAARRWREQGHEVVAL